MTSSSSKKTKRHQRKVFSRQKIEEILLTNDFSNFKKKIRTSLQKIRDERISLDFLKKQIDAEKMKLKLKLEEEEAEMQKFN